MKPDDDVSEDGPVAGGGAPVEASAPEPDEAEQRADLAEPVGSPEPEAAPSPVDTANTTPGRDATAGDEGPGSQRSARVSVVARRRGDAQGGHGITAARLTHYSTEPLPELDHGRIYPQSGARAFGKPHGFWVSVDADGDGWADWCRSEGFGLERLAHKHDVTLADDARILWLTTPADLDEFTTRYGATLVRGVEGIDWPGVAAHWQGIVIAPYQWSRCLRADWYYGWDCASGCIWDVTAIAAVRPLVPTHPDTQEDT